MNRHEMARFFGKVRVSDTGCWEWTASLNRPGCYGVFWMKVGGKNCRRLAHVVAFLEFVGPYAPELDLDHLCMNKVCCNPAHLEPVSRSENVRRWVKVALTHCPKGHPRTPENTGRQKSVARNQTIDGYSSFCRPCRRAYEREWERRRKAAASKGAAA